MAVEIRVGGLWQLTGYYGYLERNGRHEAWCMLRTGAQASSLPWCCIGDYNDLFAHGKKRGRCSHPNWLINGFLAALEASGLLDLGMVDY